VPTSQTGERREDTDGDKERRGAGHEQLPAIIFAIAVSSLSLALSLSLSQISLRTGLLVSG
jgi:hypothetical protein